MKQTKDRLHKVIVIGANPAGIAATNKMAELGIPVTLVDPEPDLDRKLAKEEWRLSSGVSFNYGHRPGLLRILRNPMIQCLLPARVRTIKHTPQGFKARIEKGAVYIDRKRCVLCGRCDAVCPATSPHGVKPIHFFGRGMLPGSPYIEKGPKPICQANCPLGVNVQGYVALAKSGRFHEALELVRRDNVLPGICGRICTHPCETFCRRGEMDEPVDIRHIKRFLADYASNQPSETEMRDILRRPEKVAVIGSGPAGLAAGSELARLGYPVTVFEKEAQPGGLLRYAIGTHRLPRDVLDADLAYVRSLGVEFRTKAPIDLDRDLDRLKGEYQALIVATGSWEDRRLGVPGEDLRGVEGCLAFLTRFYRGESSALSGHAAVIGDGNSAFDLARTLRRLGARVTILSWFPEEMIPSDEEEVRGAVAEGIVIRDRAQVVAFLGRDGRLESLRCTPTEPGPPDAKGIPWPVPVPGSSSFELEFDSAFVAIGQRTPHQGGAEARGLRSAAGGGIEVDESCRTSIGGVYAAGDGVKGPSSVVNAMAAGRAAARTVHHDLTGETTTDMQETRPEPAEPPAIPSDIPSIARATMSERQAGTRAESFLEVAFGLSETQVLTEAGRCLQCGICSECLMCVEACGQVEAIRHAGSVEEVTEQAGVVIIADPDAAPDIKGEDVIRAYGPQSARSDVYAMMTRGFAAAAKAISLVGGAPYRPKGHGLSVAPPDPPLSPDVRIGVFVCRCNEAFGWTGEMASYVERLVRRENIFQAETLSAACLPEGSAHIVKAIRERGLTRVMLASCVCCPLDYVCSACTDQRTRLKTDIFRGTGVSRSMVETCNLRGEVLRILPEDPELAFRRFTGLIERSLHRVRRLKSLPSPARTYNFTTAVIGQSEAAVTSALTLAGAGIEVFMFGTMDRPLAEKLDHPSIHSFEGSSVKALSGTLGDFRVFIETGDFYQALQVGAVIIGENSRRRIPYVAQEGLPSRILTSSLQERGTPGVPFIYPGATPISGLFLANPPHVRVSERQKGAAAAVLATAVMPRGPRQSKGYTVVVDESRCRGCGRCIRACPYQAISLRRNGVGGWHARVDEALCKGCGNCISLCPCNAADSPYRDQSYLEQLLEEVLVSKA